MTHRSLRVQALLMACALLLGPPAAADPARARPSALVSALDRTLGARALRGARIAALVVGEDGREIYARDAERRLTPASNAKVLTAVAALARLGPTHRFETLVLADAVPDAEGAVGTLLLRGSGDPAVNSEDWWQIADALRRRGLRRVRGDIVLDDSLFDHERWHPSWGRVSARAYHAPVGALNANYGAFSVAVQPGTRAGDPARVELVPPVSHLRILNRAVTDPAHTRLRVDRELGPEAELVVVSGSIGAAEEAVQFNRSILDPARYAGSLLRLQLESSGIAVEGGLRVGSGLDAQTVLVRHQGRTLAEIVKLCMKYSNNQIAEALVKVLGLRAGAPRGNWQAGSAELRRVLIGLGVDPEGFMLLDGSGLSYQDEVSPRALVQALQIAEASFEFGPEFVASLPLADRDGTLEDRAAGAAGAVRAKTGTLNRITALSGIARMADGERATFSILVNGYRSGDRDAMNAVDAFVTVLVSARP